MIKPIRERRVRDALMQMYPGFRITKLDDNSSPGSFDGGGMSVYFFVMESEYVPGFSAHGNYYVSRAGGTQGLGTRPTLFDGKTFSRAELADLQRLWLRRYPSELVEVGDDAWTGAIDPDDVDQDSGVSAKYADIPRQEVYRIVGEHDEVEGYRPGDFFRFDPSTRRWAHLPGYLELPAWATR